MTRRRLAGDVPESSRKSYSSHDRLHFFRLSISCLIMKLHPEIPSHCYDLDESGNPNSGWQRESSGPRPWGKRRAVPRHSAGLRLDRPSGCSVRKSDRP